jgi:protein-tyrosine-phosphatase
MPGPYPASRSPVDPAIGAILGRPTMHATILILCTGNATRSVIAGAVLKAHLPDVDIVTAGTMSIDGLPMSWRTRAGFESVGVTPPAHRSRQVDAEDLDRATVVIGLAPEHVQWVRREHPGAAVRTVTLKRLARELAADARPLTERIAELDLAGGGLAAGARSRRSSPALRRSSPSSTTSPIDSARTHRQTTRGPASGPIGGSPSRRRSTIS